ncbi:hypothetical protein ACIQV2_32965 [Streptomyces globosus]|uniref:hypothetical protein n=1 Tax=Streptomyces globosus TaxID=68209 RepID=UPI003801680F
MGSEAKDVEWWDREAVPAPAVPQAGHPALAPPPVLPGEPGGPDDQADGKATSRRRTWLTLGVAAALTLATVGVWQKTEHDARAEEREQKAATYKGESSAGLAVDSVDARVVARWTRSSKRVIIELSASFDPEAKYLRIDASGESAYSIREGNYTKPPKITLPVKDALADVTVQIAVGGKSWKEGDPGIMRTVRLSPTGLAYDVETGERLPRT